MTGDMDMTGDMIGDAETTDAKSGNNEIHTRINTPQKAYPGVFKVINVFPDPASSYVMLLNTV